eukprot:jgi/Ulvmu1/12557/UM090_0044.1
MRSIRPGPGMRMRIVLVAWLACSCCATLKLAIETGISLSSNEGNEHTKAKALSRAGRGLLDVDAAAGAAEPASITIVATPRQLQAAVVSQAQDIELRDHVDLSELTLVPTYNVSFYPVALALGPVRSRSIRGNCSSPPPPLSFFGLSGPELQWMPPQCVIIADHTPLLLFGKVWLDALYTRVKPSAFELPVHVHAAGEAAEVYGTRLTLQGDRLSNSTGIFAQLGGRVYMQGSTMRDIGGGMQTVMAEYSSVVLNRTVISNAVFRPSQREFQPLSAGGPYAGQYVNNGLLAVRGPTSSLLVQDSTFENVTAENKFTVRESGYIAVDNNTGVPGLDTAYNLDVRADVPLPAVGKLPDTALSPLGPADPWWLALRQSMAAIKPSSYLPEQPPVVARATPTAPVSATAAPEIAAVYTAEDFQYAYSIGVRDIELRAHIDARLLDDQLSSFRGEDFRAALGSVKPTTRSIRGNCTAPPPAAVDPELITTILTPEPWQAPRCTILTMATGGSVFVADTAHVWMDSLHLQFVGRNAGVLGINGFTSTWSAALFLTNCVVQGDTDALVSGLASVHSQRGSYCSGVSPTLLDEVACICARGQTM